MTKNDRSTRRLAADFAAHRIERRYAAIALGQLRDDTLTVSTLHGRHPTDRNAFPGGCARARPR